MKVSTIKKDVDRKQNCMNCNPETDQINGRDTKKLLKVACDDKSKAT